MPPDVPAAALRHLPRPKALPPLLSGAIMKLL